jgi:hypothetical protein
MVAFQNFKRVVCGHEKSSDSHSKVEKNKDSFRSIDQSQKKIDSKEEKTETKENNINLLNKKQQKAPTKKTPSRAHNSSMTREPVV